MIKLFVDDQLVDMDQQTFVSISLGIASVTKIESGRTGYSKTIQLPMTARNRAIFGDAAELHAAEAFNQSAHSARIEVDGYTVIEGTPMMTKCAASSYGGGWYKMNIIGAGKEWVKSAAEKMFNEIPIVFEKTISADTVAQSWEWEDPVRFFPVQRDRYETVSNTLDGGVRLLSFSDYHPFINVKALVDAIVADAGYTINSQFMDSDFFKSLYMSGKYPEKEVQSFAEEMGFVAGRFQNASATADRFGRVYADPFTTLSSIGNLVDSADPDQSSENGVISGVYNHGECFKTDESGRIGYYPLEKITVGFEYELRYRSDFRIANRNELKCFDRVYLDDDIERKFSVKNQYEDRRESFHDMWSYLLVVFDHAEGASYMFSYEKEDGTIVNKVNFSSRCVSIGMEEGITVRNPKLWILDGSSYRAYDADWALYDGYVSESGQIEIALTVRSAASEVSASNPKFFHRIHFGGADEGMTLTLYNTTRLKSVFMPHPCEGQTIQFADVAAHRVRQIELMNALKQMFNLYFYTDTLSKTIYVEPREAFYSDGTVVDWSDRLDLDKPVEIEELGSDLSQYFTLRYLEGDGYAARWDQAQQTVFGRWSTEIFNRFAEEGEQIYQNPLFVPTLNVSGAYADVPQASLIQVGDRTSDGTDDYENLNFPAKIVRFCGMQTLESGRWGWPSYGDQYPKIAFHDPGGEVPFSLCFEDRDNCSGLHAYYDKTIDLYNNSRRVTLYLRLRPEDIEPFSSPNGLQRDFRALFKLKIGGEILWCRLEEICDYNPFANTSTKCTFLKNV